MFSNLKGIPGKIFILLFITLAVIPVLFSCCTGNKTVNSKKNKTKQATAVNKDFSIISPANNDIVQQGETIIIELKSTKNLILDSVQLTQNNKLIPVSKTSNLAYKAQISSQTVGKELFSVKIYYSDSLSEVKNIQLFVLPNTIPKEYSFKVIRTIPHDPRAYTQGLLFHNGYIYESTGKEKRSSLRKLNPENGDIIKKTALDDELFGEGIAVIDNEIFMLTYVSQVGFVFDLETLDMRRKFSLQTREGWGLTSYNNKLILSDGSPNIYFFEPQYFSLLKQLEVCNNKGYIDSLNELEYTPFGLFANVYGQNNIVLIDEHTGVVKGSLDLTSLFPEGLPRNMDHVLNGIAFNPKTETFYVTGKQWPIMYEISIDLD